MTTPTGQERLRIIVGGMVGQFPLGGVAWDYFHYLKGLADLGHEVVYYEDTWCWPYDPVKQYVVDSAEYAAAFFNDFFAKHMPGFVDRWHFLLLHDKAFGMSKEKFDEFARTADVFLNVSGACFTPDALNLNAKRVFMDTDPGYNQIVMHTRPTWSENVDRWIEQVKSHDVHLSYAENIYAPDCVVPKCGIDWRITRPIVTMDSWKNQREQPLNVDGLFTTVMSWNYFKGKLELDGIEYDAKAKEYEKFQSLPSHTRAKLALAVAGNKQPKDEILKQGWQLLDAAQLTLTADSYMQFIADSLGEWSIAKNVFVQPRTGWFSCRSCCYLGAGRPCVVQDTGWSKYVPSGQGIIGFSTMNEAVAGLEAVLSNPQQHQRAAIDIAREYLAHDKVLPKMLDAIFASTWNDKDRPPGV
jgi:hypothetical protein